jgi:hypothetical protein
MDTRLHGILMPVTLDRLCVIWGHTAIVSGVGGGTGVGLVEIFETD